MLASCRNGLLTLVCSKHRAVHCQHHTEKATWALTYMLFKTQSNHCQHHAKMLYPDLHTIQNTNNCIVRMMQKRSPWPWLTSWSECRAAHCQHHAEKASWTLTYILFKTQTILLLASCRNASWTLTYRLFKTQRSSLLASHRKGLLYPDLPPV